MIRSIYFERYKKVLFAACLLVVGICIFTAISQSNQWRDFYNDPEIKAQFEADRDSYTYYDEEKMTNVPYKSYKDYRDTILVFYNYFPLDNSGRDIKTIMNAENYSNKTPYIAGFGRFFSGFALLFIVPLAGFLLFFIDQKTGFNQFLFSLGISRKDLFKKKLLYVALPFLFSILVGQSLYALLIHTLIPAPYMNATLGQLFTSVISNFCLLFILFSSSIFIGAMVGNIVFGPLTWGVYWWLTLSVPSTIYRLGNMIYTSKNILHKQFPETLFVYSVGKMSGFWWMNLLFLLLGSMLLFWAYKSFQTLSLENENTYLLYRKSRWPIWMIMTFFTSTILTINFFDPWSYFIQRRIYDHATDSIIGPILTSDTIVLIVGGICLLIVFFKEVRTTINKLQHRTG